MRIAPGSSARSLIVGTAAAGLLAVGACSSTATTSTPSTTVAGANASSTSSSAPSTAGSGGTTTTKAAAASGTYAATSAWLCHPDLPADTDVCRRNLDTTVLQADGTKEIEKHTPATDPKIDCFYVYPTVSRDTTPNADMTPAEGEEILAAVNQVARLNSTCRVFAPVYRQIPLTGLSFGGGGGGGSTTTFPPGKDPRSIAYNDVVDAFTTFLDTQSKGRGFVLVGHSQGTGHLNRLIKEKIDGDESLRKRLVSAYLLGGSVAVPDGKDAGIDFQNVPACRKTDQVGCVVSYMSFRATAPPPADTLFGKPRGGDGKSLCNNPAALSGGKAEVHGYYPNGTKGVIGNADPVPGVDTPFVSFPGLVQGECVSRDGLTWLEVTIPEASAADPRGAYVKGDLTPPWGLHLIDANLTMGNVEAMVTAQAKAYAN